MMRTKEINKLLEELAEKHLFIETLATRNNDSLDFHEVSVWGVKSALEAAYKEGKRSAEVAA